LIFIFNKELRLQDDVFYSLPWHQIKAKEKAMKLYWKEQESKNKEMLAEAKSKSRKR